MIARCEELRENGGFVPNPWNALPRQMCLAESFSTPCRKYHEMLVNEAFDRRAELANQVCSFESSLNADFIKTSCQDKQACQNYFTQACAATTKQYADCTASIQAPDYPALAKKFCLDSQRFDSAVALSASERLRPRDSLPVVVAVKKETEVAADDLKKLELSVGYDRIKQRLSYGDYFIYSAFVRGERARESARLGPVVEAGLNYPDIAFAGSDEQHSARAARATDSLTASYMDFSRGGVYGIAYYLAEKQKVQALAQQLRAKVDEPEGAKTLPYKLLLLLAGNQQEEQEAKVLEQAGKELRQMSSELRVAAPAAGGLVDAARLNSLADKTSEFSRELYLEACRKKGISHGFVYWLAGWVSRAGGLFGSACPQAEAGA